MNYLDSNFQSIRTFSSLDIGIVKFVPLVPLLTELIETHIDTWK